MGLLLMSLCILLIISLFFDPAFSFSFFFPQFCIIWIVEIESVKIKTVFPVKLVHMLIAISTALISPEVFSFNRSDVV